MKFEIELKLKQFYGQVRFHILYKEFAVVYYGAYKD